MGPDEISQLEERVGPLPADYRAFLLDYPAAWRQPAVEGAAPLSHRLPDDLEKLIGLGASVWRVHGIVIGDNGVGDPYILRPDGSGVFLGDHETGSDVLVRMASSFEPFVALLEGEHFDFWRDACIEQGRATDALRLADAAVAAWKRYGKSPQATKASRARTSLRKLVDPAKNAAELRALLAKDPAAAASALASAMNVSPALVEEILEADMFGRQRAVAYAALPRAIPQGELVPWALRRAAETRRSPEELFWLDWALQRSGADRAARDALYAWLPDVPAGLFGLLDTAHGRAESWVELPLDPAVDYPFGAEDGSDDGLLRPRTAVAFACRIRMTRAPITEQQVAPFRAAFTASPAPWRAFGPREPARIGLPDAIAFARWLEIKGGLAGVRLPTEEEWETACRAGTWWTASAPPVGVGDVAWFDLAYDAAVDVGGKAPNPWGLHDMVGLASEWTLSVHEMEHLRKPRPARQVFDPREVLAVPSYRPDYQATCGGQHLPGAVNDPAARAGSSLSSGLDPTAAFRLCVPIC